MDQTEKSFIIKRADKTCLLVEGNLRRDSGCYFLPSTEVNDRFIGFAVLVFQRSDQNFIQRFPWKPETFKDLLSPLNEILVLFSANWSTKYLVF